MGVYGENEGFVGDGGEATGNRAEYMDSTEEGGEGNGIRSRLSLFRGLRSFLGE
jgi:hypothetical protein